MLAGNEQGFAMLGGFEKRPPGTAADLKAKVQDNNQKPNDACPARTTAAMLLMLKITTSCPNIAKHHVVRSPKSVKALAKCGYKLRLRHTLIFA